MLGLFRRLKGVDDAWSGVVTDKRRISDGQAVIFRLIVALDGGGSKHVSVRRQLWKSCEVGDRVVKPAGERYPAKTR